jgi:hypothetical protein
MFWIFYFAPLMSWTRLRSFGCSSSGRNTRARGKLQVDITARRPLFLDIRLVLQPDALTRSSDRSAQYRFSSGINYLKEVTPVNTFD